MLFMKVKNLSEYCPGGKQLIEFPIQTLLMRNSHFFLIVPKEVKISMIPIKYFSFLFGESNVKQVGK